MDFFEAQARAHRRTKRLVFLFALAVLGTILAGYAATMFALGSRDDFNRQHDRYVAYSYDEPTLLQRWWDPRTFLWITGGTVLVVGLASLFKWSQLRSGGPAVAEMLGGRRLEPGRASPNERRLLNVVEEMAIASGVPIPPVYVLDDEPALNAFAAGLSPGDAVVAVTRGTLEKLSRDELQGVVAHEFSHILNGDMRLNVKLTAIVFGILVIGLAGRSILWSLGRGRVRVGGSGKNKGGGIAVIVAVGVALLIIGYVGYFFGRLIQAAVSRQREFLADASAVQFTRNPNGITGALKKIGGYALGGTVLNKHAGEIGHFFFAQSFKSSFGGLWATHPPLDQRIRAIEPQWDGALYQPEQIVDVATESFQTAGFNTRTRLPEDEIAHRLNPPPALPPPLAPDARIPFQPTAALADIGALTESHFRNAQQLLQNIPPALRDAATDSTRAQTLIYGLLLSSAPAERAAQRDLVTQHAGADSAATLDELRPALSLLDPAARLPLLLLAAPALRTLDATALDRFVTTLDELVHADGQVSSFEFVLQKVLTRQLRLAGTPAPRPEFFDLAVMAPDLSVVLSTLARAGNTSGPAIANAFLQGAAQLKTIETQLSLRTAADSDFADLDAALDRLAASSLPIKKRLLSAAAHVIGADATVTIAEGELFRAIAIAIDCPMPLLTAATADT